MNAFEQFVTGSGISPVEPKPLTPEMLDEMLDQYWEWQTKQWSRPRGAWIWHNGVYGYTENEQLIADYVLRLWQGLLE